ncbi:hypothetical protein COLO4_03497 [Corchorus olitorius]|uniref:Trichome birefringence-like N-terminal domain-containing protein n=1 Tax=Corchorus olitorius TaxID=93759 RepID=A0A1R3KY77_9ROSI|nr:hypothetical protein COLO4_03497 [Corchorus olitorius]
MKHGYFKTHAVPVAILYGEDFMCIFGQLEPIPGRPISQPVEKREKLPFAIGKGGEEGSCDIFSGRWVRDELTRPLYDESECPYIQPQLTCQEHGRPDTDYQKWRWQPHGCDLPRKIVVLSSSVEVKVAGGGRRRSALHGVRRAKWRWILPWPQLQCHIDAGDAKR